jgi:hypothetical protein
MRGNASRWAAIILAVTTLSACNLVNNLQAPDDKAIASDIQAKLFQDPVLKLRDIQVASQKGVVVLTGSVNTELERAAAERMASEIKGVKQVVNQLNVAGSPGAASQPPETAPSAANNPPPPEPKPIQPTARKTRSHARPASHAEQPDASSAPALPAEEAAAAPPPAPAAAAAEPAPAPPAEPTPPPPPQQVTIPAGTVVSIRMIDGIDSERNKAGEEFAASLAVPVVVDNQVVIPEGSDARVRLVQASTSGRMSGQSELQIELIQLSVNGTPYSVRSGYYQQVGASRSKRTAETVGGGAVLGALIGAIAGHGKGAAIGAGVGAAAGAGAQAATKGQQVKVPPETKIEFTLKAPVTVTL